MLRGAEFIIPVSTCKKSQATEENAHYTRCVITPLCVTKELKTSSFDGKDGKVPGFTLKPVPSSVIFR